MIDGGDANSSSKSTDLDLEPSSDDSNASAEYSVENTAPAPKRYAHHGKRRRSYTEELFRCQFVDKISRSDLVCNSLLWRDRPEKLREHLLEHITAEQVQALDDSQVRAWYSDAKRIFLEGIPEDESEEGETDEG